MTPPIETLSFVCNPRQRTSGSTYLRGFQLAEIAANRLASVRIREIAELDRGVRDEVLVFNKSCLKPPALDRVLEALPGLRRHNACLADPVDLMLAEDVFGHFDGAIAASIGQAEHLSSRLSNPVFLVHHHVDTRLPPGAREWDHARLGYFGELSNTWHVESVADRIDFFSVDTTNALDISWARHLRYYNAHYCLRRVREIDGFKPATKLFVAASLEAPAIIERRNDEVERLLPGDYPYFVDSTDLSEVRRVLDRVVATFGKDEWMHAKASLAAIDCYRQDRVLDSLERMMASMTGRREAKSSDDGVGRSACD